MAIQTTPSRPPASQGPAPQGLEGTGFQLINSDVKRRMIMSVEGDWGTGKTDLALTAPGPIGFFKLDLNSDWTVAQWASRKKIYRREVAIPKTEDPNAQALAEAAWKQFQNDYARALASSEIRSVIWDTATELWELCRLTSFGRLSNILPHHYAAVNNSFRALIKAAFDSDTNLIMVHRLKDQWENYQDREGKEKAKKTGRKERAGFGDVGFACQVMVQTYFDNEDADSPFSMKVLKCTQNPRLTGRIYGQVGDLRMNAFPILAADVFPGTDYEKDWV